MALGILSEGGGHAAAAGFTLNADREKDFCDFLEKSVNEQLGGIKPKPEVLVDGPPDVLLLGPAVALLLAPDVLLLGPPEVTATYECV